MNGNEMTLWETLVAGGSVMIIIGLLSLVAVAIIAYDIMMLNVHKLIPNKFYEDVTRHLKAKDIHAVRTLCVAQPHNIIAKIVLAGLNSASKKPADVRESIEQHGRIEITKLWQNLNYLSDIVTVAPLLGLLGTVLGMVQAFQAVPVQSAAAKTALLVAGISKAMVATAAGLLLAILVLMAYSYFRGKVQQITNTLEIYGTEIIKHMEHL